MAAILRADGDCSGRAR